MRMRKKRWLILLLVLFIGIILPTKAHAMELKDTDESVVKWDTAKISSHTNQSGDLWCDYNLEQEKYSSYKDAVENISRYAVDLVDDRKGDRFHAYIPFTISTDKENLDDLSTDVLAQVKQWMMFGNDVTKHEILSFSYSRSGGYENLRRFEIYVEDVKQTGIGFEGKLDILAVYSNTQDFFQKYETGVQNAVKDMDVAGKSDYDKAYAVCKWIGNRKNIKYNLDYAKNQSGMYAMVERQAVCAGMTKLCNYMGRYVGLDVIDEEGATATDRHAWNLMKIDGEWYYSDPTNCKSDISTYESFLQGYDWLRITTTAIDEAYKDDRDTYKTQDLSYLNNHSSCNGNHVWNKGTPKGSAGCVVPLYFTHECKVCHAVWWEYLADPIGHDYVKYKVTQEATCTKPEITKFVCSRFNDDASLDTCDGYPYMEKETAPALGHDWKDNGDGTATCQRDGCGESHTHIWKKTGTVAATCTDTGKTEYTCTVCGQTKTTILKALGHKYEIVSTDDATCTTPKTVHKECTRCHDKKDETSGEALGHNWRISSDKNSKTCIRCKTTHTHTWDEGKYSVEPTCKDAGKKLFTCTDCGDTKTVAVKSLGHDYQLVRTDPATCTTPAINHYACSRCEDKVDQEDKDHPALGHDWKKNDDGTVTCQRCGQTHEHKWDTEVISEASCTTDGVTRHTCSICGDTYDDVVKGGHKWTYKKTGTNTSVCLCTVCGKTKEHKFSIFSDKESEKKDTTCTKAGYTGDTYCKDCGELLKTGKETDALGHTWGKGKVTRKSTYTAAGQLTYTCSRCGEKRVITTKKLFYPKAGTKYTVAGCQYKVTKAGAEVSLIKTNKNAKSVTIPAVIKVKGVTYKVTSIGVKAFNGSKKLTKVTVGANIKAISNNAFYKCKSLKAVTIKSVLLTKKTTSKKAFKGTNKKMVIKVPKKVKKAYVKIFKGLKVKQYRKELDSFKGLMPDGVGSFLYDNIM